MGYENSCKLNLWTESLSMLLFACVSAKMISMMISMRWKREMDYTSLN